MEGDFTIEAVMPHQTIQKDKPPSVRLGICDKEFDCGRPLGSTNLSYGYSSLGFISHGCRRTTVPGYTFGDLISIKLHLGPPLPRLDGSLSRQRTHPDSYLSFYKNGNLVKRVEGLPAAFFCFGFSLFRYGSLKVNWLGPYIFNFGNPPTPLQAWSKDNESAE
jgi:hypothetical protein